MRCSIGRCEPCGRPSISSSLKKGFNETCVMECVVEGEGTEALERLQSALSLVLKKS